MISIFTNPGYSQVSPSLQFSLGLAFPGEEFGGDLVSTNDSGISYINSDFVRNNYAVSTGATFTGTLKFPFGQQGTVSALFIGSYTYFNAFRSSILATTIENNLAQPVTYDNRFSTTTFGFGVETSPFINSKFSPFINANLTLNILSLSLQKNDFTTSLFNDAFRMGLLTNAGISVKLSSEYSLVIGGSYHLCNLLLKSQYGNFEDRVDFERENLPINDEEGTFYSNLSDANSIPVLVNGTTKNVNWWNINLGLNIMLGKSNKK